MAVLAAVVIGVAERDAGACGCFTPPDPSVPVVQAGERILFAMDSGTVTAHIQIQYAGDAAEFGWLLPLPSVPVLALGTDELFNRITTATQPKYRLTRVYDGNCGGKGGFGGSADSTPDASAPPGGAGGTPLVIQDSIGPYDYAVLHADSKSEMLKWLDDNRYFVPAGTDDAVAPYIRQGAYFLALKLRSGKAAGDLQPVVVKYASDLPMIPIVLTSVAAQPDMGIQVWMLGAGRAIPHNYFHTVIDDARIDWFSAGANYNDVIIAATKEAEGRHTFVTEYAGSSSVMRQVLDPPGRFGAQAELAAQPDPVTFVSYLNGHGFPTLATTSGGGPIFVQPVYSSQMLAILGPYIPVPAALLAQPGFSPSTFYAQIGYYLGTYRQTHPQDFAGYTIDYRPVDLAADLWTRVVTPTLEAGALFQKYPYLTRLYTTLSPEQMNRDPVFSFNPGLPEVSNVHEATLTIHCGLLGGGDLTRLPATLRTEQGYVIEYPDGPPRGAESPVPAGLPASTRIEIVSDEGPPKVVKSYRSAIVDTLDRGGCQAAPGGAGGPSAPALGLLLLALARLRRARRPRPRHARWVNRVAVRDPPCAAGPREAKLRVTDAA